MQVSIFGKHNCGNCQSTKKMFGFFLGKWGIADKVKVEFYDMDTTDGLAESAFHDVSNNLPTVIIANGDRTLARWEGKIPQVEEVKLTLLGANTYSNRGERGERRREGAADKGRCTRIMTGGDSPAFSTAAA